MYVSQSLIKKFLYKGDYIPHCPKKNFLSEFVQTEAMKDGVYFETKTLGGGRGGKRLDSLKLKKNGEPYAEQVYIDNQVQVFKEKCEEYSIEIIPMVNTQIPIYKEYKSEVGTILLRGEIDMFPIVFQFKEDNNITRFVGSKNVLAMVDLKLTENVSSDFNHIMKPSTVGWGDFKNIDHIQASMYHFLSKDIDFDLNDELNPNNHLRDIFTPTVIQVINNGLMPFIYWVFDKKKDGSNDMFVVWDSPSKEQALKEDIRKVYAEYQQKELFGDFDTNPNYKICKSCNLECNDRIKFDFV